MIKPNFFLVGAAKAGTTSMNNYLSKHPDIFLLPVKDYGYFNKDINPFFKSKTEYLKQFDKASTYSRVGESCVWYLYSEIAAKNIKKFNPKSKIIIMLRNPVDMIYSYHNQLIYILLEDITDFGKALEAESERKKELKKIGDDKLKYLLYTKLGKLSQQVERYLDKFERDNIKIIVFDDFVKDTSKLYKETLRFLDVDDTFTPNFKVFNPNKKAVVSSLNKLIYQQPKWFNKIVYTLLPDPSIREKIVRIILKLTTKKTSRPKMNNALKKKLKKEFKQDVKKLEKIISRDLSYWYK